MHVRKNVLIYILVLDVVSLLVNYVIVSTYDWLLGCFFDTQLIKIINGFAKHGFTDFANNLSTSPWRQSTYNKDLLALRGFTPLIKRLKSGNYELLAKPITKSISGKKTKGK